MILVVNLNDFFRLVNMKVSGRTADFEYGQIYYIETNNINLDGSIETTYCMYYGDEVWKYKTIISKQEFESFYGLFEDFQIKYKPIELINIEKSISLKVVE